MNKHLHRIIFNTNRGQLMVVAESATAQGKAASGERGTTSRGASAVMAGMVATLRPVCFGVLASLGMVLFTAGLSTGTSAQAQIVADRNAPGGQRPTVLTSGNGVPVVNIQTPSAGGVSRNTYSQFDVNSNGVILNNSRVNTPTQLGGYVQGNPWLATGSARVILNEVNSSSPSQLRGYIEVGGQRAEVIVANPAGVAIDGAGFINASRVTITTGSAQMNGGSLEGYLVQRGQVTINGKGLDTSSADYTAILARAVQVNGGIWAKELNVTTGANQISATEGSAAAVVGGTQGQGTGPLFALDVSQLGGMYAGKILLIGTESGVGVRSAGSIGASAGQVQISVDGMLTNSGSIQAANAAGNAADVQISTAGAVQNSGTIYATGNTNIAAVGSITTSGFIAAQNNTTVQASGVGALINATIGSVTASGLNADGSLRSAGDLRIAANTSVAIQGTSASAGYTSVTGTQLNLSDAKVSGANIALTATNGNLDASRTAINTQGTLSASSSQTLRTDKAKVGASQINVSAHDVSNVAGQITQFGSGDLRIQLAGDLDNTSGRIATNSQNLSLSAATLTNSDGTIEHAGSGTLAVNATTLNGQRSTTVSNGALVLNATTVNLDSATTSAAQMTLSATTLSNRSGTISQTGTGQTTITASQALDNTAGKIETNGNAMISTATLTNAQGRIATTQGTTIVASSSLDNTDGTIAAAQNLTLTGGTVSNTRGNLQAIAGNATLQVTDLNNTAGSVFAGTNLSANTTSVTNTGNLYAAGMQTLNATGAITNTGTIAAQGDTTITANSLTSGASSLLGAGIKADGSLATAGELAITAVQSLIANGQNLAAGNSTVSAATMDLSGSQTSASNIAITTTIGNVVTSKALVTTPGTFNVTATANNTQALVNQQGTISANQLNISTANLTNTQGKIIQTGTANTVIALASPSGILDNTQGNIAVNSQTLTIKAETLLNVEGTVEHAGIGALNIKANTFNTERGDILSNGNLNVVAGSLNHDSASTSAKQISFVATTMSNRSGIIEQIGNGPATITVGQQLDNTAGHIASNGNLSLTAGSLNNIQGRITSTVSANVSARGTLDNGGGTIAATQDLAITSKALDNTRGVLQASTGAVTVQAAGLTNVQGVVSSATDLTLTTTGELRNEGTLYAGRDQKLTVGGTLTNTGSIAAQNNTTVKADTVYSSAASLLGAGIKSDGSLAATGNLSVAAVNSLTAVGQNLAAGNASLTGATVDLSGSQTSAQNIDLIAISGNVTTRKANVATPGTLSVSANVQNAQTLDNAEGVLNAGQLNVLVSNLDNTQGEIIQTGSGNTTIALSSTTGTLNNTQGRIAANSNDLTLNANTLTNTDGRIEHAAAGTLAINAANLNDQRGQITGNGSLLINSDHLDHRNASTVARQVSVTTINLDNRQAEITQLGNGQTTITASQSFNNAEGTLQTNGDLTVNAVTLNNTRGRIATGQSAAVTASTALDNTDGSIAASQNLQLTGGNVVNTRGSIQAVAGSATLQVADLTNAAGSVYAGRNLDTTATHVTNSGNLYAAGNQTLTVSASVANSGVIAAQGNTSITANSLNSSATSLLGAGVKADGSLSNTGNLSIATAQSLTANGQNLAAGNATLHGSSIDVSNSQTSAANIAITATSGNVTTAKAAVVATGTLAVIAKAQDTQALDHQQGLISAAQLDIQVANLNNSQAEIIQTGTGNTAITLTSPTGKLDNTLGRIAVNSQNITLGANTLINTGGHIEHAGTGTLAINAFALNDQAGNITSNGALTINAGQIDHRSATTVAQQIAVTGNSLDNRGGHITQLGTDATSVTLAQGLDNRAGSIASNGNTAIAAQSINNQGGTLQAAGASSLAITTGQTLDNSNAGNIAAGGNATLITGDIANQEGKITAGGRLDATATQALQNTQGLIAATGNVSVTANTLNNTRGSLASVQGNVVATTADQTINDSGKIQAASNITLTNNGLSNTQGLGQTTAGSITGQTVTIDTRSQALNNQLGTIAATHALDLQTGTLNNDAGLIQATTALTINTHGQTLTNTNTNAAGYTALNPASVGGVTSGGTISLTTGAVNNSTGYIGAIGAISGTTGQINNTAGGQIVSQSSLNLSVTGLNNQGGQVQASGDITLNADAGNIDNRASLIRSGGTTSLTASSIDNRATQAANQGIEGKDIALTTAALINTTGAVRADSNVTITSSGSVNNTQGLVSAGNALNIADNAATRSLAITNTNGTLISGKNTNLRAASLTGDGKVLGQQDLSIDLATNYTHNAGAEITANRDASITTTGNIVNYGVIQAGRTLAVTANNIDNTVNGDINGGITQVTARNTLTNRGVIDGIDTQINAGTLNNLGTGRIYGDYLSIGATTVNNQFEGGTAATIAARARLDIGAQTINNSEHALIFSGGDMSVGGNLDADRFATGSAATVTNASATIEALGGMSMNANQINNRNNRFSTTFVTVSGPQNVVEYQGAGSPNRYAPGSPNVYVYNDESDHLHTPEGNYESWLSYNFTRTVQQTVIASSDPGRIIAGGNIVINTGNVLNDNSHVIAGNVLRVEGGTIDNTATAGQKITSESGTATSFWRNRRKGRDNTGSSVAGYAPPDAIEPISLSDSRREQYTAPVGTGTTLAAVVIGGTNELTSATSETIANVKPNPIVNIANSLGAVASATGQSAANAQGTAGLNATSLVGTAGLANAVATATGTQAGSVTGASGLTQAALNVTTAATISTVSGSAAQIATGTNGPGQARVNPITQVTLANPSGGVQVVRTTLTPAQIPNTSLFRVNPAPTASFLIETDPRFANYRQWLGSDYLLGQLQLDPTVTQKRLGDGFYEQKLIREQVAQLTGLRFLGDYTSDDAQYRALMDASVTYAKAHKLRPGIALSPAQMAALTADIVWLVEQEVTLPNGQVVKALVPQVYVRVKEGDLDGTGALLAGKEVNINLNGNMTNTGTVAGRSIVSLTADNVNNLGGRINADAVAVNAKNDLNNIGGTISANSQLLVTAGRDINVITTTRSASSTSGASSFSRTNVERVAGLYVAGNGAGAGTLVASAGRDINITAGIVANGGKDGDTILSAKRDLNLSTVTTGAANNLVWDAKNRRSDSQTTELGSQVVGAGRINLVAGQDINAKAATVQAGAGLAAIAGNNINLTAGQNTQSVDESHQHTSKGLLSKKTFITRDTMDSTTSVGSTLEGQNVLLKAGNDINVQGSAVNAQQALVIDAKRDVNITATQDTYSESHYKETKREATGLAKGLATVIAVANPLAVLVPNSIEQVAVAGLLTKSKKTDDNANTSTTAVGSQLTGGSIAITSGRDTLVQGSTIVADGDISVKAGRNLTVTTAENTQAEQTQTTDKTSGLLRFQATGNSVGKREQMQAQQTTAVTNTSSQIVSLGKGGEDGKSGNINLQATGNTTLTGSSVMAPGGDISISGANVLINEAVNTTTQASQTRFKETAASVQLKSGYVDAIKGVAASVKTAQTAKKDTGSDRMAGLATLNAVATAANAYQGLAGGANASNTSGASSAAPISAISISGSIGQSKSQSSSQSSQTTAVGSTVAAGKNLTITANGDRSKGAGNLTTVGATLSAGKEATLEATGDINLLASQNTATTNSTNSSSNASMGATLALGGSQNGLSFQAGAQGSKGRANGNEVTYNNTTITVGSAGSTDKDGQATPGTLNLKSGGNTTLRGATASADTINADIKGNLTIESLQDQSTYDSKQTSAGAGVSICIPPICYGTMVAINVNAGKTKINGDHLSVGVVSTPRQPACLLALHADTA